HEPPELGGQRIAVFGTGSSGVQVIPEVAKQAEHLYVFQRTPGFTVPSHNGPIPIDVERDIKASYPALRRKARESAAGVFSRPDPRGPALSVSDDERVRLYEDGWERRNGAHVLGQFTDLMTDKLANDTLADFLRDKIRALVRDEQVAERLL